MNTTNRARCQDIIELAGRWFAFARPGDGTMPRVLNDLIAEAVELCGGWDGFSGTATAGTADLPVLDAVLDRVMERANELRRRGVAALLPTLSPEPTKH
jgi:hypothetical protein